MSADLDHARLRALTAAAFIPSRVDTTWQPLADATASDFVDSLIACGAPIDLMHLLAVPLPVRIICRILGLPEDDTPMLRAWSTALLNDTFTDDRQRQCADADIAAYLNETIPWYMDHGQPGTLLADLIDARDGHGDRMGLRDLTFTVRTLLLAGHSVMANIIGAGTFTLLATQGRWSALVEQPGSVREVVEDILRQEVPGYPDRRQLVHGGGTVDYDLGISLARTVHVSAFGTLAARLPTLRLAVHPAAVQWSAAPVRGPVELSVIW